MTWFRRRTGMRRFKDDDGTDRFRLLDALPPGHTTTLKRKKNKPLGDIYIYIYIYNEGRWHFIYTAESLLAEGASVLRFTPSMNACETKAMTTNNRAFFI